MSVERKRESRGASFLCAGWIRQPLEVPPKVRGGAPKELPGLGHLLLTWGTKISQLASNSGLRRPLRWQRTWICLPHKSQPWGKLARTDRLGPRPPQQQRTVCLWFRCFQAPAAKGPQELGVPNGAPGGGAGFKSLALPGWNSLLLFFFNV